MNLRYILGRCILRTSFYILNAFVRSKYTYDEKNIYDLIKEKKSFVRWGDGETALLLGSDTYFQKSNFSISISLWKLLIKSQKNSIYIVFPQLNKMVGNVAFTSTIELREIVYRIRKNYLSSNCALEFRDSEVLRDTFACEMRSAAEVVLICSEKFKNLEHRLKNSFGPRINVIYCSSHNAALNSLQLENLLLFDTIILAAGPIIKCQVLEVNDLSRNCLIVDLGHGLDRILNG